MDIINTLSAQLRDLFQSMTPGARITAGLLLAVVVVSMGFLFQQGAAAPDEYLFGGEPLAMSQISRMEAAMAEAGLSGWEVESNRIRVPRGQKDSYIAAIASAGALPPDFSSIMKEAIAEASPLESRHQWELRTKAARENQFSHLISSMAWVEQAHVMFDIEERRGFGRKNQASATVFVTPRAGEAADKMRMRNLKEFVAGAMTSLSAADVRITNGGGEDSGAGESVFEDPYLQARADLQRDYRKSILDGLSYIPGVRVEVSGNIDNLARSMKSESILGEPKVISSITEIEDFESGVSGSGGRPGQVSNSASGPGRDDSLTSENRSKTHRETENSESTVPKSTSEEERVGYVPKEMFASIALPRDYVTQVWKQRNPDAAEDELTKTVMETLQTEVRTDVENFVTNILPQLSPGENEYEQVKVVFYDALQREPPAEPSLATNAMAWAGRYWSTLSMVGLAMFSLLMLRSVVRSGGKGDGAPAAVALELDMADDDVRESDSEEEPESDRPKLRLRKGDSLKDDLSEMVRENPDGAAAILRTWIGSAS
ncbi:MAG: hypothetical protein ACR2NU_08095 [Aeoliella sp.]